MRGALLHAPGDLRVEEISSPSCPEGGLLVKVEACSICASDVKMSRVGHRDLAYPRVLGHEVVGTVVKSRSRRRSLRNGARVQIWPGIPCGRCHSCLHGYDNQCSTMGIIGFNRDGGFAELMAVPAGCVRAGGAVPVPGGLSSELASLTEPLACCINAQDSMGVREEDSVLVIGAGPLGALHLLLARQRGASRTYVIEVMSSRREAVARARPDGIFGSTGPEGYAAVVESNEGRGLDVVILATPDVPVDSSLLNTLAPRGRLCLFSGLPRERSSVSIDLNQLHYPERTVVGSYGCRSADDRSALGLLSSKELDAAWLITKRVSLGTIEEGLRHTAAREGMKATVIES